MTDPDERPGLSPTPVPVEERADLFVEFERAAGTGAYVWESGRRLLWSEGFFRLLDVESESKPATSGGELFFERVHPEDREYVREHWAKALQGEATTTRYRIVRPDGTEIVVQKSAVTMLLPKGTVKTL